MMDTTALDRQLSDLVYLLVKSLRSGYSLRESVAVMAETAPEPVSRALQGWQADLEAGRTHEEALANLGAAWPSPYLAQIADAILQNQEGGGSLAAQLALFSEQIYQAVGSDGAFYPEMRRQAATLGGPLPDRVQQAE
jgi:tight adherence protein B